MKPMAIIASHPIQYQTPLYRHLTAHGIPLHVYFLSQRGQMGGWDVGFGREVTWDVPLLEGFSYEFLPSFQGRQTPEEFFGLANFGLLRALDSKRHSATLVHGWRSLSSLMAVMRSKVARLPILYRSETTPTVTSAHGAKGLVLKASFKRIVSVCLSIGTLNDRFYEQMGVPPSRRVLVPYAVDNGRFAEEDQALSRTDARDALGVGHDELAVLFAGKLVEWKRPDLLMAAAEDGLPSGIRLIFAGSGPLASSLERRASENGVPAVFTGFLNQSEMCRAYASGDLLVLPSKHEPWGLVVNEAMNFRTPALVSDVVGCAPDLVRPDTGAVFRTGDAADLREKLIDLLSDRQHLANLGSAAQSRIREWSYVECEEGIRRALSIVGVAS